MNERYFYINFILQSTLSRARLTSHFINGLIFCNRANTVAVATTAYETQMRVVVA